MEYRSAPADITRRRPARPRPGARRSSQNREHTADGSLHRDDMHHAAAAGTGTGPGAHRSGRHGGTTGGKEGTTGLWCTAHGGGGSRRRQIGGSKRERDRMQPLINIEIIITIIPLLMDGGIISILHTIKW